MRRSPAEFYIRYRLIRDLDATPEVIVRDLADELVFVPGVEYLTLLRGRMRVPDNFRPGDLTHGPSQTFLRDQGIWSLWHPSRGTMEAKAIFENVRARSALQTMIAGSVVDDLILEVVARRMRLPLSPAGLAEFKHYYWNVGLLTRQELADYVRTCLHDEEMARIAALPPSPSTTARALFALGVEPGSVNEAEMLRGILGTTAILNAVYERDLPPGPAQAVAIRNNTETALAVRDALREIEPAGARADEVLRLVAGTRTTAETTLQDLRGGRPPAPVGLLPAEADDDGNGERPRNAPA